MKKLSRISLECIEGLIPNPSELENAGKLQNKGKCSLNVNPWTPSEIIMKTQHPKVRKNITIAGIYGSSNQAFLEHVDKWLEATNKYLAEAVYVPEKIWRKHKLRGILYQKID